MQAYRKDTVNGNTYGMKVNARVNENVVHFYFDEIAKFDQAGELLIFTFPRLETFGCTSGYLGLRTHTSAVNFDWAWQSAEPGLAGWTINLDGPVQMSTTTGPDGSYCFKNLPAGSYRVWETLLPGWAPTFPVGGTYSSINVSDGESEMCINFGNIEVN